MKKRVDAVALLFSVLKNKDYINQYRFELEFNERIDPILLQKTIDSLISFYPLLFSKVTKDFFLYSIESLDTLKIENDPGVFKTMNYKLVYDQAIHVFYKDNKLAIEAFHALSDGCGMMTMMKELVSVYESLKANKDMKVRHSCIEEQEDAYATLPTFKKIKTKSRKNAFKFPRRRHSFKSMHYEFDLSQIKMLSKQNQCTINDMMLALFYKAIRSLEPHKSIIFSSPINLRQHFPSRTLRNFTLNAQLVLDDNEPIITQIQNEMAIQDTKEYLGYENTRIQRVYRIPLVKYCPLFIKEPLIRLGYFLMGEKSCMTITNLGLQSFGETVKDISVYISPRLSTPINCAIISSQENLKMSISHDGSTPEFFECLESVFTYYQLAYRKKDA